MARAKRTDRAAARRRHRAELAELAEAELARGEGEEPSRATDSATTDAAGPVATPTRQGSGLVYAFRAAWRPVDLRGDVAALPTLIRSRAFWLPNLLILVAIGICLTSDISSLIGNLAFAYFIYPFPVAAAFLSGFLAPRASYLLGIPVGLLGAGGTTVIVGASRITDPALDTTGVVSAAFAFSPPMSVLFAAAAAWYKRFLALANPNRGRRQPPGRAAGRAGGRSAVARR